MDTLKQLLQRLLDGRAPYPAQWSADEVALLRRVKRPSRVWVWTALTPLVLGATAWVVFVRPAPAPQAVPNDAMEVYFRLGTEPATDAMQVTFTVHKGQTP